MKKILFAAVIAATALCTSCKGGTGSSTLKTEGDTVAYELGLANSQGLDAYLMQQGIDSADIKDFLRGMKEALLNADNDKKRAYYLGLQAGLNMYQGMIVPSSQQLFGGDSTQQLSAKALYAGLEAGTKGKTKLKIGDKLIGPAEAMQDVNDRISALTQKSLEQKYGPQKQAAAKQMTATIKKLGLKQLAKGVYYKEVKAGDGQKPKADETVEVDYVLSLFDGKVLEDSKQMNGGKPAPLTIASIIPGLQAALTQMPLGAEWDIYVAAEQAYGAQGAGPQIPPYTNLHFNIKLISIKAAAAQQQ